MHPAKGYLVLKSVSKGCELKAHLLKGQVGIAILRGEIKRLDSCYTSLVSRYKDPNETNGKHWHIKTTKQRRH